MLYMRSLHISTPYALFWLRGIIWWCFSILRVACTSQTSSVMPLIGWLTHVEFCFKHFARQLVSWFHNMFMCALQDQAGEVLAGLVGLIKAVVEQHGAAAVSPALQQAAQQLHDEGILVSSKVPVITSLGSWQAGV